MPELPEVESTVRYLRMEVIGKCISAVNVLWRGSIDRPGIAHFKKNLCGSRFIAVERRGKYIVMQLRPKSRKIKDLYLLTHLRMSGNFDVVTQQAPKSKHDRVILTLDDKREIRFNDTRKFGRLYLVADMQDVIGKLGIEPLDSSFSPKKLHEILSKRRGSIKPMLLDQTNLAGLGNIYADEVLWLSRIHPLCAANSLSLKHANVLFKAIRRVLTQAIESQGTDFGDGVVEMGMYRPRVYGREDQKCFRCKSVIARIVICQRSSHFCPVCQRP